MVTPDLARATRNGAGMVVALTGLGALAGVIDPALAGHVRPHPTLTGTPGQALGILAGNARILAVPFALAILRLPESRLGRTVGDVTIATLTGLSTVNVGIALGRWGDQLIPYLPHLPLEWAALSLTVAAWLLIRNGHAPAGQLAGVAAVIAVLLVAAAGVETFATPHPHADVAGQRDAHVVADAEVASGLSSPRRGPRGIAFAQFCRSARRVAARSQGSLSLVYSLGFARRLRSAGWATSTTGSPQGGNHR